MTNFNARSVVVTGASGFIGTALVKRLCALGAVVHAVAPRDDPRLSRLEGMEGLRLHPMPALTSEALLACVGDDSPEMVFHLAARGVDPRDRDPRALLDGNPSLLLETLEACRTWRPSRIVFTGSCSEYGPVVPGVRLDENGPRDIREVYGAAKVAAHTFGHAVAARYELPLVTLRLFGIYGPGEAENRLIPYLAARLKAKQRVDLTAGEQVRDMTFVGDVIEALLAAARAQKLVTPGTFNVCSGRGVTIRSMCLEVARQLAVSEELLDFGARPYRQDEPMWLVGDPERFQEATGWEPRVDLQTGIALSIAS
jgi:nucleoside-diphosphate-sugar epimerase